MRVLIVGTGLIGTSVGLALTKAGHTVWLRDTDSAHQQHAIDMGAGVAMPNDGVPDVVLIATPPAGVATVAKELHTQYVNATFTDVSSIKSQPVHDIESLNDVASRFVGGHPMAGRETSGPAGARADLFKDRLWILTTTMSTEESRLSQVRELVIDCGAIVTTMDAAAHDRAVALTSHTPQVLSSLMAGLIAVADAQDVQLAGQGLRDLTRIAGSNPELWDDILTSNANEVDRVLAALEAQLEAVRTALRHGDSVAEMLRAGNAGRQRIPARHGGLILEDLQIVSVDIADRPGELARLFAAAGEADISIDDVRIDHVIGREAAIVDLSVKPERAERLRDVLSAGGWQVRS